MSLGQYNGVIVLELDQPTMEYLEKMAAQRKIEADEFCEQVLTGFVKVQRKKHEERNP